MKKRLSIILLVSICYGQDIKPLDKIIKTKKQWYRAINNNIIEVKKVHKDVDFLKSNDGLIVLPLELEKKLKGKKTPEELEQSMDRVVGLKEGSIANISKTTIINSKDIKPNGFLLLKKAKAKPKTNKLQKPNDDFVILYKSSKGTTSEKK